MKSLQIVNRAPLNLLCTENVTKELNYLVAKDYEHAKMLQQAAEVKTAAPAVAVPSEVDASYDALVEENPEPRK